MILIPQTNTQSRVKPTSLKEYHNKDNEKSRLLNLLNEKEKLKL